MFICPPADFTMGSGISSLSAVMQEGSTSRDSNRNERLCNGCEICLVVFSTFKRKVGCFNKLFICE